MKRISILLIALTVLSCNPERKAGDPARISEVETSLSTPVRVEGDSLWTIEERMAKYGVPGVSIAVIYDNKIAWSKGYGVMHKERREPVTTTTLFQAGSISKPVAAYGALRLVAAGKIKDEENVNTYLKTWKLPENEFTAKKAVTLNQLLSHTGGLTVHGFLGYSPDLPVPTLVQVLNGELPANSPPVRVDKLPGEGARYSGGGYTIMQQMLMDVEGKDFPQIMQEQVLGPLGMTHSTYEQPLPPSKLSLAAAGYVPNGTMTKGERHTYPEMAAAGLWTTAEDLARYAIEVQLAYAGKTGAVMDKATATRMLTPYRQEDYGLGHGTDKRGDDVYFGHGGWDEGFSSEMIVHRDKGYGVVVLTNANQPPFIDELIRAVALTYKWDNYVPSYKALVLNPGDGEKVVGRYKYDSDQVVAIYLKNGDLVYESFGLEPMKMFKLTDSTYIRRERTAHVQIKRNPEDGVPHLIFLTNGEPSKFNRPLMKEGEKVPSEWFAEGDYERAKKEYQAFIAANPADEFINEGRLNSRGYNFMNDGKLAQAKAMFAINMALYPSSPNVYDSYAEACMKNGDKEEAIKYYQKTLSMKPDNEKARKMLEELTKK
jgi:CubicO group peptidase (beta-lactamase class C family)